MRTTLVATIAIALLAAPSLALGGSPACGVYCEGEAPDPGRGDTKDGGGGSPSSDESTPTASREVSKALKAGDRDVASLAGVLGVKKADQKGRDGSGKGSGNPDGSDGYAGDSADRARHAGASLAGAAGGDGPGLGGIFPLLLAATALWAVVVAIRRRRSGSPESR